MAIIGNTAGAYALNLPNANTLLAARYPVTFTTTVSKVSIKNDLTQAVNCQIAIYSDNGGTSATWRPATLVAQSVIRTNVTAGQTDFTLTAPVVLNGGSTYWFAILSSGDITCSKTQASSGTQAVFVSRTQSLGFPSTFPVVPSTGLQAYNYPIFCTTDAAAMFVSKANVYAIVESRVLGPVKVSQAVGYAVVENAPEPIKVSAAHGFAVVQDPFDPIKVSATHGYAIVESPPLPIKLSQAVGYAVIQVPEEAVKLSYALGYAVVEKPVEELRLQQCYGLAVVEEVEDQEAIIFINT